MRLNSHGATANLYLTGAKTVLTIHLASDLYCSTNCPFSVGLSISAGVLTQRMSSEKVRLVRVSSFLVLSMGARALNSEAGNRYSLDREQGLCQSSVRGYLLTLPVIQQCSLFQAEHSLILMRQSLMSIQHRETLGLKWCES